MATWVATSTQQICDSNGVPVSGAVIYVYDVGTTTLKSLYSNAGLSVSAANPIECDSSGRHDVRYMATGSYKILVKTEVGGSTLFTRDYLDGYVPVGSGALAIANGGTGETSAAAALAALGGATSEEVADVAASVAAVVGTLGSSEKTHIATGTTAQRPSSPSEGDIRRNTTLAQWEAYDTTWRQISVAPPVAGGFKNLLIVNNSSTPNSKVDVTADAVTVETTNGVAYRCSSISLTIDCSGTGANGIDAGALANDTWYAIWIIYNPTSNTTAGLISSSFTSPTMPTDYTAKARIGTRRTNGSAQFHRIRQLGRIASYVVSASVTTVLPVIASGATGTYSNTSPTLASTSVATIVPSTASRINIVGRQCATDTEAAASIIVAPNSAYSGSNNGPFGSANMVVPFFMYSIGADDERSNHDTTQGNANAWLTLESTNLHIAISSSAGRVSCYGYEDNI